MTGRESAESLALQALAFLLGDDDRRARFLAASGLGATALREGAADPAFLAGVLDQILGDEALLLAFCQHLGIDPAEPAKARRALPGGASFD